MNIVFDLGGVVFRWQPDNIVRHFFDSPKEQALVKQELLEHSDWVELDRGTITCDEAVQGAWSRTGLRRERIEQLLRAVPRFLTPKQDTIELIRSISYTNNRLFVLSNMHKASIAHLEENYDIWEAFEGVVISSRIERVKPEIAIYDYLLSEYELSAADTVFIDDMQENLSAAASVGIRTIRFATARQCRTELVNLGCI